MNIRGSGTAAMPLDLSGADFESQKESMVNLMRDTLHDPTKLNSPRNREVYRKLCSKETFTMEFVTDAVRNGETVEDCINNLIKFETKYT